jgi:hypothetical protein
MSSNLAGFWYQIWPKIVEPKFLSFFFVEFEFQKLYEFKILPNFIKFSKRMQVKPLDFLTTLNCRDPGFQLMVKFFTGLNNWTPSGQLAWKGKTIWHWATRNAPRSSPRQTIHFLRKCNPPKLLKERSLICSRKVSSFRNDRIKFKFVGLASLLLWLGQHGVLEAKKGWGKWMEHKTQTCPWF